MNNTQPRTIGKMAVIVPAAFLSSLAIGTVNLGLLFVIKDMFDASASQIGWLGALWSSAYFCGCLLFKPLTARLAPRLSMVIMQGGSAMLIGFFLLLPSLPAAFIITIAYGFLMAFFWPPLMGWLSRGSDNKALAKANGLFNFAWSLGAVISPYLAGILSERHKLLPVLTAGLIFAVNAVFIQVSRSVIKNHDENEGRDQRSRPDRIDQSSPLRFPAWLGIALTYMVVGVSFNVFPVYARNQLLLSESSTGFILTLRAMTTMAGFYLLGRLSFWQFRRRLIPSLSIALGGLLLIMVFIQTAGAYLLSFGLFGALMAMIYTNSLFYATNGALDKDKRVTTHEALLTGGQVLGSISGGLLLQYFSMPVVFGLMAGLILLGGLVQAWMVRATAQTTRQTP